MGESILTFKREISIFHKYLCVIYLSAFYLLKKIDERRGWKSFISKTVDGARTSCGGGWQSSTKNGRTSQPASASPYQARAWRCCCCSWWPLLSLLSDGTRKLDPILNMFLLFIAKEMCISWALYWNQVLPNPFSVYPVRLPASCCCYFCLLFSLSLSL